MIDESGDVGDVLKHLTVAIPLREAKTESPRSRMEKMDGKCYAMLGNEIDVFLVGLQKEIGNYTKH